jgi:hypothetical protein
MLFYFHSYLYVLPHWVLVLTPSSFTYLHFLPRGGRVLLGLSIANLLPILLL